MNNTKPWNPKNVTEAVVKDRIIKPALKELGAWIFMPVQTGMGNRGVPDFVTCVPVEITPDMVGNTVGMFVAIEAKAPNKRKNVSAHQEEQISKIIAATGVAEVVHDKESMALVKEGILKKQYWR